mgnify:CR=1 FL=1
MSVIKNGLCKIQRNVGVLRERRHYARRISPENKQFWILSCTRNAGDWALKCLDSIQNQDYPRDCFNHLFIDDASTDSTDALIRKWLQNNPGHNVQYQRNETRLGGTANTLNGFRMAPPGSIVLEVNGDDWLPDSGVLAFLNKVYVDADVWMTYNSYMFSDGRSSQQCRPYPPRVVRENAFREYPRWISSHLHTFRSEVFGHLREETFFDPATGQYWESADDMAIYLAMLELCGIHSRHLFRVNYVYNYHEASHEAFEAEKSLQRVSRIRKMAKHSPLNSLLQGLS